MTHADIDRRLAQLIVRMIAWGTDAGYIPCSHWWLTPKLGKRPARLVVVGMVYEL